MSSCKDPFMRHCVGHAEKDVPKRDWAYSMINLGEGNCREAVTSYNEWECGVGFGVQIGKFVGG